MIALQLFSPSFIENIASSVVSGLIIALILEVVKAIKKSVAAGKEAALAADTARKATARVPPMAAPSSRPAPYTPYGGGGGTMQQASRPAMGKAPSFVGAFLGFVFHVTGAVGLGLLGAAVVAHFAKAPWGSPLMIGVIVGCTAVAWLILALIGSLLRRGR